MSALAIEPAEEDIDWYRYEDDLGVERFVCQMGDCGFDKGFTHIGSLNHHMMPEHGHHARNVRTISVNKHSAPAPCVTRSASKLAASKSVDTPEEIQKRPTLYGELPDTDDDDHECFENSGPWDVLATRAKDARLAFEDTKEVLRGAIEWCEDLSNDIKLARDRHAAGNYTEPIRGSASKRRTTHRPSAERNVRKRRVSFPSVGDEPVHHPNFKVGPGLLRQRSHGSQAHGDSRPQIWSSAHGGVHATDPKIAHDLEKCKGIIRANGDKILQPPGLGPCASPEMVRKWMTTRNRNSKWDVADPIPTWHEVGQPSSPVLVGSGSLDGGRANFEDALIPEWEANEPIRYSKCDPDSLLMNANESIKEVIELGDRNPQLVWDIDRKSPMPRPRGDSIRRPILLPDSPKHEPTSEYNSGPAVHRTMETDVGAVNLRWEPNGRSQSVLVRVPKMFSRQKTPYALPSSPPSACRLLKDLEDSAPKQMVGSGSKNTDLRGIENLLGQVDNAASNVAIGTATQDSHGSKVKAAFPVPITHTSDFCNLSTQSIQWIIDGLDNDKVVAAKEKAVSDSESL